MTEIHKHEPTTREFLGRLTQDQIVDYMIHVEKLGEELQEEMDMAADVLESKFGITASEAFELVCSEPSLKKEDYGEAS